MKEYSFDKAEYSMSDSMSEVAVLESPKRVPVEPGFWVLIFGDLLVFSVMFVAFMLRRFESADTQRIFSEGAQLLNPAIGLTNTVVLLTSSFFVARAVVQVRKGETESARKATFLAIVCGLGFISLKLYEYSEKLGQGITVTSSPYFEYYFIFTGIHLFHVVIGTGLLIYLFKRLSTVSQVNQDHLPIEEGVACYWHMVDLLWLMLFALFYLLA